MRQVLQNGIELVDPRRVLAVISDEELDLAVEFPGGDEQWDNDVAEGVEVITGIPRGGEKDGGDVVVVRALRDSIGGGQINGPFMDTADCLLVVFPHVGLYDPCGVPSRRSDDFGRYEN